jgi:hypothetical protein
MQMVPGSRLGPFIEHSMYEIYVCSAQLARKCLCCNCTCPAGMHISPITSLGKPVNRMNVKLGRFLRRKQQRWFAAPHDSGFETHCTPCCCQLLRQCRHGAGLAACLSGRLPGETASGDALSCSTRYNCMPNGGKHAGKRPHVRLLQGRVPDGLMFRGQLRSTADPTTVLTE